MSNFIPCFFEKNSHSGYSPRAIVSALVGWVCLSGLPVVLLGQAPKADRLVVTAPAEKNGTKPDEIVVTAPHLIPHSGQNVADLPDIKKLVISKPSRREVHEIVRGYNPTGTHLAPVLTYYEGFAYTNSPYPIQLHVLKEHGSVYVVLYISNPPVAYKIVDADL